MFIISDTLRQAFHCLVGQKLILPAFGTWQVVILDLDGRKWELNQTIMTSWPISRLLWELSVQSGSKSALFHQGWLCTGLATLHIQHWVWCRHHSGDEGHLPVHCETYRELLPSSCQSQCPDGLKPSRQHIRCLFQGSGSSASTGRSTNSPCQRPARTQVQNNRENPHPNSLLSLLGNHPSTKWIHTMGCLGLV